MLKLEVTDGSRVMKAIEYARLPGMVLGETCLGAKVSCKREESVSKANPAHDIACAESSTGSAGDA
jgi:hypothetical protein